MSHIITRRALDAKRSLLAPRRRHSSTHYVSGYRPPLIQIIAIIVIAVVVVLIVLGCICRSRMIAAKRQKAAATAIPLSQPGPPKEDEESLVANQFQNVPYDVNAPYTENSQYGVQHNQQYGEAYAPPPYSQSYSGIAPPQETFKPLGAHY